MFYAAFKLVKALQCSNDITKLHRQIMISGTKELQVFQPESILGGYLNWSLIIFK